MSYPVSLTMIARNEEGHLRECLACVADLVEEIIVVDTGSTDRTREVARECGAQVFEFAWRDDFAAARNEALRHTRSPWVFWMDADDRIDAVNRERLKALFASLGEEQAGYIMNCFSLRNPATGVGSVAEHLRVFRNHPEIRWENRIHEQVRGAVERCGHELRQSEVVVQHLGYLDDGARKEKAERNLRLLQLENAERPGNPYVLFNIGRCYQVLGRIAEAVPCWQESLHRTLPGALYLRKLYALLVEGYYQVGRGRDSLAVCEQGRVCFPDDPELLFHEGTLRIELGDLGQGEACMRRILEITTGSYVNLEEPQLRSKARHNLAVVYRQQGRLAEAERELRACLAEQPGYKIAWLGLGSIWLEQGRLREAEEGARILEAAPELAAHGESLRGRILAARGWTV